MSLYKLFGGFILADLLVSACSNKPSQNVIIADTIEGQSRQFAEKIAQKNSWPIHKRMVSDILQEDSLAKISSLVLPSSQLNQLHYRDLNALKRYLEAGGGLLVVK